MGDFVISPLLPVLPKDVLTVGSLCSAGATPRPRSYGPIRHPLVFRRFPDSQLYGVPCSHPISRRDEEGFSSCLARPCHRAAAAYPAEVGRHISQRVSCPCCLHPGFTGWAFGAANFEATPAF